MSGLGGRVVPSLLAVDLAETIRFYTEKLGFEVSGRFPEQGPASWAELRRDGVFLQFFANAPLDLPNEPVISGTLYFYPDDLTALAEEFAAKVGLAWGPEQMDHGYRELGLQDCNGYFLAFAERL